MLCLASNIACLSAADILTNKQQSHQCQCRFWCQLCKLKALLLRLLNRQSKAVIAGAFQYGGVETTPFFVIC